MQTRGLTRTWSRAAVVALCVAAAPMALAACGSSTGSPATAGGGGASSAATGGSGSIKGKKVALVSCGDINQWCKAFNNTLKGHLAADGVDVTYLQDPFDAVLQGQHLDQAVAQKPDAILLIASDAKGVVPGLRRAKQANVPVINLNGPAAADARPYIAGSIEANMFALGKNAAEAMFEGLAKAGVTKGNIIAITGTAGALEVPVRMDGFKSVLSQHPAFKLVETQDGNWDQVKAAKIVQQLLAKYRGQGGIVGAYGMADQMAAGIIQAAKQAGITVGADKKGLVVVGSNCFKIGMQNIANGDEYGTSTQAAGQLEAFALPLIKQFLATGKIPALSKEQEAKITKANLSEWRERCSVA
jgi:ribose transport system substrate-binding protein